MCLCLYVCVSHPLSPPQNAQGMVRQGGYPPGVVPPGAGVPPGVVPSGVVPSVGPAGAGPPGSLPSGPGGAAPTRQQWNLYQQQMMAAQQNKQGRINSI